MRNKLKITISGIAGSGKSHTAYLIEKTLRTAGFNVFNNDPDMGPYLEEMNETALKTLALAYGMDVTINHKQLRREAK